MTKKISALTAVSAALGADEMEVNEAGTSKKVTITQIAAFLATLSQTLTNKTLTSPVMTAPVVGAASATSLAFTSTSGVIGTATNDSAAAGSVGELIESEILIGANISLTNNTPADVTSISLTAGNWHVWGLIAYNVGGSTLITSMAMWINTTSATSPTAPAKGAKTLYQIPMTAGATLQAPAGQRDLKLSGTTTAYLSTNVLFSVSTCAAYGYLGARRVR